MVVYEVECRARGRSDLVPSPASYGWAHFHAFADLLAAEERICLGEMMEYGGVVPWSRVETCLRPIFDPSLLDGGILALKWVLGMQSRLHEVCAAWGDGSYAGSAEKGMKAEQFAELVKLLSVVDYCVKTRRSMRVR
ncbi:hypothetical protein [Micromonospora sp. NPDC057140]|uniref:hypothetical protein n=1 Tax=Micromonospora sp. NPDC057140 TaxID=3346032 RepID=UPI003638586F